jgi:hypothetical protein
VSIDVNTVLVTAIVVACVVLLSRVVSSAHRTFTTRPPGPSIKVVYLDSYDHQYTLFSKPEGSSEEVIAIERVERYGGVWFDIYTIEADGGTREPRRRLSKSVNAAHVAIVEYIR